jgi:hypothetical protein
VLEGWVSRARAEAVYGVVLDESDLDVDVQATARLRAQKGGQAAE